MPIANPLIQGGAAGGFDSPAAGAPNDSAPAYDPPPSRFGLGNVASVGFNGPDNTSLHVGILVAAALAGIILLHVSGFRFAVDAGVTRS